MADCALVGVLAGVNTLYIITPGSEKRAELVISTAQYARQAGVKHIAVVSVPTADLPDTIIGRQLSKIEKGVSMLGVPYIFIRVTMFMENLHWFFKDTIVEKQTVCNPVDPDKPFAAIAIEDIGKASAAILVDPDTYSNKTLTLVGECHTYNDFIMELSAVLGKKIKYIKVSYETAAKGMIDARIPEDCQTEVTELMKLVDASSPVVTESHQGLYLQITGEEPTSLKKWITKHAEYFFK